MKKLVSLLAISCSLQVMAQNNTAPEGYSDGYFVTTSNQKSEVAIKPNFKKGSISVVDAAGSKKNYTPSDINAFALGNTAYIAYLYDFYKMVTPGNNVSLLQKVTDNSGKLVYNGAEAYAASTTEGKLGAYYLRIHASDKVVLVTKENFETVFASYCADCTTLVQQIRGHQLDYASIEKAVLLYNECK